MAVITPSTELRLLKVPLEIDDVNQLTFANATAQYNYFNSLPKLYVDDFTYQRKDGTIRFSANFDEIITYNYVMYQNSEYSDKWFYAYITDMQYVNDNMTMITIKTDIWQTWQFSLTFKPCLIDREHANTDVAGDNLLPEGLEHGEYVCNGNPLEYGKSKYFIINADKAPATDSNGDPKNNTPTYYSVNVGGVAMSGNLFVFDDMATLTNAFLTYSRMEGGIDHVKQVYIVNELCLDFSNDVTAGDFVLPEFAYYVYKGSSNPRTVNINTSMPATLDSYTPVNQKLLTSPYHYMLITNNNGSANSLDYEYFGNKNSIALTIKGISVVGCSILAYPNSYKNTANNYMEGIIGGKLPTLSWSGDAYTNWLTQNAVNIRNTVLSDVATVVGGIAVGTITGGAGGAMIAGGAVVSGIKSAHELMQEQREHKKVPNSFNGNVNGGDINTANRSNTISIYHMSITSQFAQRIDQYFSKFGYKCNKVKLPNIFGRRNWNYVKTVECYIEADIPQNDLQEIKNMFDKGVTFWHNPATFADYSQNNDII